MKKKTKLDISLSSFISIDKSDATDQDIVKFDVFVNAINYAYTSHPKRRKACYSTPRYMEIKGTRIPRMKFLLLNDDLSCRFQKGHHFASVVIEDFN